MKREAMRLLGLALIATPLVILTPMIGWWALAAEASIGAGWLLVFIFGLPTFLKADLSQVLQRRIEVGKVKIDVNHRLHEPTQVRIWEGERLIFDGVSRDALLARAPQEQP